MSVVLDSINEQTSRDVSVSFTNSSGISQIPDAVSYRIDCQTNEVAVKALTSITPAADITIPVTVLENVIINDDNALETKRITLIATWGTDEGITEQIDYDVNNLRYVT